VERELIYRALLEVKNDIMEMKDLLRRGFAPGRIVSSDHPQYEDATVASSDIGGEAIVPWDKLEKRSIIEALERFKGNRRLASKALNISERTLYRKIKEYGITSPR
jgi:DNA-binding NtrC family response regulator